MPINTVSELRAAIEGADIPEDMRRLALDYLATEPEHELDQNALRAFFWFGPLPLREYATAILGDITDWPVYLKDLRTRLGMTQRQFGHAIGAGVPTVSRWETGAVTPSPAYQRLIREFEEGGAKEADA